MITTIPSCFIIMPISTPEHLSDKYSGGHQHFLHILEHMFIPAIEKAGYKPILPTIEGSLVIHSEILRRLITADMALSDMSALNPNVFFEMGLRTALNKPIAIVKDEKTTDIPFDTNLINYHTYSSSASIWEIDAQIENLKDHILATQKELNGKNGMWEAFDADRHILDRRPSDQNLLGNIERELTRIRREHLIPSAHTPGQARAKARPMEVFGKMSDLAADSGFFIDLGDISDYRICIKQKRDRMLSKSLKNILRTCGERYGYKVIFE